MSSSRTVQVGVRWIWSRILSSAAYLGPLTRRFAAFAVDTALATAVCLIGLWLDDKQGWLSGFDGAYLGYTILVLPYIASEVAFATSPGKAILGLRIATASGQRPLRIQLLARALTFWLLFLEPTIFLYPLHGLPRPLDFRGTLLLSIAATYALLLLPAVTILCSRGFAGFHDFVTGTALMRRGHGPPQRKSGLGRRMISTSLLTYAIMALLFVTAEWKWNLGAGIAEALETHGEYLSGVLGSPEATAGIVAIMSNPDYTSNYVNTETGIAMPGATEYYSYPVTPGIISDPRSARDAAYDVLVHMVSLEPHGLSWYQIELISFSRFGFLVRSRSLRLVIDRRDFSIKYAPTEVRADSSRAYCATGRSCRPGEKADSEVIYYHRVFERRVYRSMSVVSGGWRFPDLSFRMPMRITEHGSIGILPAAGHPSRQ